MRLPWLRNLPFWTLLGWAVVLSPLVSTRAQAAKKHGTTYPLPPELVQELTTLRDAALEDNYAYDRLTYLTENIGARPSGSVQAAKAVAYVAEELRKLGLEVRLEEVQVPHWVRGLEAGELVAFPGQADGITHKIVLTALGGSTSTGAAGITADVVVVTSFDELTKLGRGQIAGKIVLFDVPFDKRKAAAGNALDAYGEAVIYRGDGAKAAAQLGALASLARSAGGADYRLPHTGWSDAAGIPAGAVPAEDASLIAHLAKQGRVRMHLTLTPERLPDVTSHNVVADFKGSEHPEQVVVVSGHLDSWDLATGAIDDAAGVAIAMETAHLLKKLQLRPKRTLRVIAWMDEESGGTGHAAYAKAHGAEFVSYVGAIESDLGAEHPLGFNAKVSPAALPFLEPVQEILRSFGANLMRPTSFSPGSDVTEMAKAGVPTFGVMQEGLTYFNYHHTAADTLDKVDPGELRENAAAMAVLAYTLTNMPEPLPR
jgi:Zn-dependent M28 family amino/carboxypeptidase